MAAYFSGRECVGVKNEAIQKPNREMRLKSLKMDADALVRKRNSAMWIVPIGKLSIRIEQ